MEDRSVKGIFLAVGANRHSNSTRRRQLASGRQLDGYLELRSAQIRCREIAIAQVIRPLEPLMRKGRYSTIPRPTGTYPHCGFIHRPADLLRLDSDNLQCRRCEPAFPAVAVPAQARTDHPDEKNSRS
jgi:hypothetical protein